jgi:hypothetical protein
MDISLYGNLTIDTIIKNTEIYKSIGSMGNVWDALVKLDGTKSINLEPIEYGEALVFVDTNTGVKVSKPNLQIHYRKPNVCAAKWHHITYVNRLRNLDFLSEIHGGIVSADVAGNTKFSFNNLQYVDYLFVADDECKYLSEFIKYVKIAVIVHGKAGSMTYIRSADSLHHITTELSNVNVLGAGDYFASAFIVSMLDGNDLDTSLTKAHIHTFNFLKNYE